MYSFVSVSIRVSGLLLFEFKSRTHRTELLNPTNSVCVCVCVCVFVCAAYVVVGVFTTRNPVGENNIVVYVDLSHTACLCLFLQHTAATVQKDRLAQVLLQNGKRFGRQHVVYQSKHAYPAYVVKYRMVTDATAATLPVVRAQCSAKCISVSVGNACVYKANPRVSEHAIVLVAVNFDTLVSAKATLFNIHDVAAAKAMITFLTNLGKDEIIVVAATNRSIPSKWSPVVVDVLRSLRSVGGSLHVLDCPYVLVGAAHPYVLNGLVHEDHQPGKAAVVVDARVIQHNRNTVTPNSRRSTGTSSDDMIPVRWQRQNNSRHGPMWKDLRGWSSQLTAAYQAGQGQVVIGGCTADLIHMKVRSVKIRCLNWKGETLAPLCGTSPDN